MKITFQNEEIKTAATTLGALLAEQGVDADHTVVEINGEAIPPGEGAARPLIDGDIVSLFRIVAGG